MKRLEKLKKKGEKTLSAFITEFTGIENRMVGVADNVKTLFFTNNVNRLIAQELDYRDPTTLVEAIHMAIRFNESHLSVGNRKSEINAIEHVTIEKIVKHRRKNDLTGYPVK